MSKYPRLALAALVCFLLECFLAPQLSGLFAQEKGKKPKWSHALDLKCRKGGEEDFDKATLYGIEVFKDENNDNLIYICQTGSIAVVAGKVNLGSGDKPKKPTWSHALDLKCRKGGEEDFAKSTLFGVEVFKDENTDNLVYISEKGSIAVIPGKATASGEKPKKPKWSHALDLKCRKGGEEDFEKATLYGVEVFKDENNSNLIYISQTASIAVVGGKASLSGEKPKKPRWSHALDLKVRKGNEEDFDKATLYGVEVFKDENTENLVYIAQTGAISVIPGKAIAGGEKGKKPKWTHALDLKCRKGGEEDFEKAETFGVEAFKDENNGNLIYISQAGAVSVVPAK